MKIIDLSHSVHPEMPVYPGDKSPKINLLNTISRDGFRGMEVSFNSHLGTHLDVPAHVLPEGRALDQIAVEKFFGSCCCIDLSAIGKTLIEMEDLTPHQELITGKDFVLFQTSWSRFWGADDYFNDFPTLSRKAALWLADFPLKGIGSDTVSMDRLSQHDLPVHRILLGRDINLIENLAGLEKLPREGFMFSCFPVKTNGADGFPVRAVAVLIPGYP